MILSAKRACTSVLIHITRFEMTYGALSFDIHDILLPANLLLHYLILLLVGFRFVKLDQ
jgi:hypothetical protein